MNGVIKGKLLNKLKSIQPIGMLNQYLKVQTEVVCNEVEPKKAIQSGVIAQEPNIIDVAELLRDLEKDFDEILTTKRTLCSQWKQKTQKTFEQCLSIHFLLQSFRVLFYKQDVSMHIEFKEEMWRLLDIKALFPRLFIRGRYICGAEEVLALHEQGKFRLLFQGVLMDNTNGACEGCAVVQFVLCFNCNGSHKVVDNDGQSNKCTVCNENGLIICPFCY
ncbi:hypothetical protein I3842_15G081100 [Carya illinoinensis]|uniref:Glutaredoxin domain-containing protein n=1 Tax=Carya illinoinensis TaxID=32201 RepID=A0A922ABH9_CARIL|nr:hypothetical protein I3842_15G081100 [Carya illinoinensis]